MVNFLFSHHYLFGLNHFFSFFVIYILFSFAHIYSSSFIRCRLVVCMWLTLSTPTITEPPSVECQDLLIPCQIECMCSQNRPWFIVPSERLSNEVQVPVFCYHKLCLHSKLSANSVTMATAPPLRRLWQLHQMLLPGLEPGTQVRRLNHSAKLSPYLVPFFSAAQ